MRKPIIILASLLGALVLLSGLIIGGVLPSFDSPQPTPEQTPISTSRPGLGTVRGVLLRQSDHKPFIDADVFLAEVINSSTGQLSIAALDNKSAPNGTLDHHGRFLITNVPPKTYGLVMATPIGSVLLKDQVSAKSIIITMNADQYLDVGEIVVSLEY